MKKGLDAKIKKYISVYQNMKKVRANTELKKTLAKKKSKQDEKKKILEKKELMINSVKII